MGLITMKDEIKAGNIVYVSVPHKAFILPKPRNIYLSLAFSIKGPKQWQ